MTSKIDHASGRRGVQAGRARKRQLWILVLAVAAIGLVTDGAVFLLSRGVSTGGPPMLPAVAVIAAATLLLLLFGGVWLYLRLADELERRDNLIAFSVGFLFNLGAYIAWYCWFLGGLAPRPQAGALFLSTAAVATLAYGVLKVRRAR